MKFAVKNPISLPATAEPGAIYYIPATINGVNYMQMYVGKTDGSFQKIMTKEVVDEMILAKLSSQSSIEKVANYTALATMSANASANTMVIVADTSDDTTSTPSPGGGVGLYFIEVGATNTISFLADMDLTVSIEWDEIKNKPEVLGALSDDAGRLKYGSSPVVQAANGLQLDTDGKVELGGEITKKTTVESKEATNHIVHQMVTPIGTSRTFIREGQAEIGAFDQGREAYVTATSSTGQAELSSLDLLTGDEVYVSANPNGKARMFGTKMGGAENHVLAQDSGGDLVYRDVNELVNWDEFSL